MITDKQREVLVFVGRFVRREHIGPTLADICNRFGWSSRNAALCHVTALRRHGLLEDHRGRQRAIRPTPKGWELCRSAA